MEAVTIAQIEKQLKHLPPQKLAVVLDFVSYLVERELSTEAYQTMLASEDVIRREWERPEEDEAWAHL
jgi:hypothetical protein